ncbi:MAG TPA: hypothetical protein VFE58_09905 [Tepidisphaeraceae bacterium]|jgi:hypothetical protein|nr:hypothetical protein [Tepidisphaeraceae bacterium]
MPFSLVWTQEAEEQYHVLKKDAEASLNVRKSDPKKKATRAEGLFKQVHGCIQKLLNDPRHPGLKTHKYDSLENPYSDQESVFEAYAQNKTPGAYRVFWCYGPSKGEITIIAITPHP